MCGIVYGKSLVGKPVNRKIINQYLDQRSRGMEGFGFYIPETNQLTHNVREGRILSLLRRSKAKEVLFHHRFPTSTANVRNGCHPFSTKDAFDHNYVVVHNGVLNNEDALKLQHDKMGIKYVSLQESGRFNDSEALAYDVAAYIEGKVDKITASGSIAFIAIQRDSKKGVATALYFGRNTGNPLVMKRTKKNLLISSEGEGELIEPGQLYRFDYDTLELTKTAVDIPTGYTYYGNGYSYQPNKNIPSWDDDGLEDFNNPRNYDEYGNYIGVPGEYSYSRPGDTAKYFLSAAGELMDIDHRQAETAYVASVKRQLLDDGYNNLEFAFELGEEQLSSMKERERLLKDKVEVTETATDTEIDDYCTIIDDIWFLEQAVEELRKEVVGKQPIGFLANREPTGATV